MSPGLVCRISQSGLVSLQFQIQNILVSSATTWLESDILLTFYLWWSRNFCNRYFSQIFQNYHCEICLFSCSQNPSSPDDQMKRRNIWKNLSRLIRERNIFRLFIWSAKVLIDLAEISCMLPKLRTFFPFRFSFFDRKNNAPNIFVEFRQVRSPIYSNYFER